MQLRRLQIESAGISLAGLVYVPDQADQRLCTVMAHGYTASKESLDLLAGYLCGHGWPCLTFDLRGHKLGGSGGRLDSIAQAVDDLDRAVDAALGVSGARSAALVGHSFGAMLCLEVGARRHDVVGVCTIASSGMPLAGFDSPTGEALMRQRGDYVEGADAPTMLAEAERLAAAAGRLGDRPSLHVAARSDALVRPERVRRLADTAGPHARYAEVEGDHVSAPGRARAVIAQWLGGLGQPE